MKRLIILRHAKAVAKDAGQDFERVLAGRGREEMKKVARYLAEHRLRPDLALVSPAARTRETWSRAGLGDVPVRFVDTIYEAETSDLLAALRSLEDGIESVVLVGHNPGLEDLALTMPADSAPLRSGLPTAALAVIDLPATSWRDLRPGTGRIESYVTPASLGIGADG